MSGPPETTGSVTTLAEALERLRSLEERVAALEARAVSATSLTARPGRAPEEEVPWDAIFAALAVLIGKAPKRVTLTLPGGREATNAWALHGRLQLFQTRGVR